MPSIHSINVPICIWIAFKGVINDVIAISHHFLCIRAGVGAVMDPVIIFM